MDYRVARIGLMVGKG